MARFREVVQEQFVQERPGAFLDELRRLAGARPAPDPPPRPKFLDLLMRGAQPDDAAVAPRTRTQEFARTRDEAARQMTASGIPNDQRTAHKGRFSDALYSAAAPWAYPTMEEAKRVAPTFLRALAGSSAPARTSGPEGMDMSDSEDMWRLFLGKPQQSGTMGISKYRPSHEKDGGATYYYADEKVRQALGEQLRSQVQYATDPAFEGRPAPANNISLGNYQLSHGQDEHGPYLAYYDKWDFNGPLNRMGKPFEVYDRIYYDPKTFKIVDPQTTPQKPMSFQDVFAAAGRPKP